MRNLALLVLLFAAQAFAQPPADPITGSAALGYLSTSGNTDSTNANASFKLTWDRGTPWLHDWSALAIAARTDDVTTAEAYAAAYKAQRAFSEATYLFASGDWRKDRFSGYEKQITEAFGYGRRLIDMPRQMLAVEGGVGAKQSTLVDGTELDEGIIRGALEYSLLLGAASEFSQKFLVEAGDDNRYMESTSALKATLIGNLSLVVSFVVKNNSDVPVGIENTDRFTAIALEYGF